MNTDKENVPLYTACLQRVLTSHWSRSKSHVL